MKYDDKLLLYRLRRMKLLLSDTYPYSFRLGRWLRLQRPEWDRGFIRDRREAASLPLAQARDHAFLHYCELHHQKELDDLLIKDFLPTSPVYLRQEFENTVLWYIQEHANRAIVSS